MSPESETNENALPEPAKPLLRESGKTSREVSESRRPRVSRSVINFWLDILLAIVFVILCSVASIIQFVFPSPQLADGWTLWGMTCDQFVSLQFGILCVLAAGIVLHVMLHWSWVCGMLTRGRPDSALRTDDGTRTIVGVAVLIALLHVIAVGLVAAHLMIQHS